MHSREFALSLLISDLTLCGRRYRYVLDKGQFSKEGPANFEEC